MHVPPGLQPCPSCYAYCVPRPHGHQGPHGPPAAGARVGAPPVPRHAHPQQQHHHQCQQQCLQQQQQHDSPGSSPHHSPHRTQPRPCSHPPQPSPDNRFGSLPHHQPMPKVPPHYSCNSLPHHQPGPPPPPPHQAPRPPTHTQGPCDGPIRPPHGGLPPGQPHINQGLRPPHHFMPPAEPPPPPPPPHAHPRHPHRCPHPAQHPQVPPCHGNGQPRPQHPLQRAQPPHQHPQYQHPRPPQQSLLQQHPPHHPHPPQHQAQHLQQQQHPAQQHPHPQHPHPPQQQQQQHPPQHPPQQHPHPQHPHPPQQQQQQQHPPQQHPQHPHPPQQVPPQHLHPHPQQQQQHPQSHYQHPHPQIHPHPHSHPHAHPHPHTLPSHQQPPPLPKHPPPQHPPPQIHQSNGLPQQVNGKGGQGVAVGVVVGGGNLHPNNNIYYNSLPPPRPPPLPPPLPPPQPFQQVRYGCLPHQQLVPPPPPPQQQQRPPLLPHQHHYHPYGCHHHLLDIPTGSPAKLDRGYNGKGPPGRGAPPNITKSYSVEGSAPPVPPHHLHHSHLHHHHNGTHNVRRSGLQQAVSQGSGVGLGGRRGPPRGSTADDTANRNSRWRGSGGQGNGQGYELSQDFADMRLEMLERRYGGIVARRAAVTIQRAYRRYAMYKKFRSITTAKAQEKRLSRRFTVDVEWNDMPSTSTSSHQQFHDACTEFDQLQRNISAAVYSEGRRPSRSMSMRDAPRNGQSTTTSTTTTSTTSITTTASTTTASTTTTRHQQQDSYDLHDTLAALSDSSLYCHVSALSPLTPTSTPTPAHTHVRNGSGDYQAHQNDRELKYFSEDSGLGSQEGVGGSRLGVGGQRRGSRAAGKKVPPEVPRRTSSIKSSESSGSAESVPASQHVQCHPPSLTPPSSTPSSLTSEGGHSDRDALSRSADNGSLSSVQSSGSDSSLSQSASDRATPLSIQEQGDNADYQPTSPVWKRKNQQMSTSEAPCEDKRLSQISENSEDSLQSQSSEGMTYSQTLPSQTPHSARYAHHAHYTHTAHIPKVPEVVRKRQYRVGLNLFNKKPERGITYLINRGFLENSPQAVAKFLLTRKGLSKQMIGEYLGNLQNNFNMAVLECFAHDIDLSGMQVDVALRKFQTHYRMPGEAQKIERLMQVFAQRYCQCNRDIVAKLRDPETIFVLAFAIIMLNTDLHTASMKQEKRMKIEDFIKNLRGIDDGFDIEREMLEGMYQRIKSQEFRPGHDHVTQVLKVQQTMVGKKPNLALPHRRLVCYCRLYEIPDVTKKERVGVHQREVFLFNDLLVVTKIFSKKKNTVTYTFRQSFPLAGLTVSTREVAHYPFLMELRHRVDNKILITFNARNEHDRTKFCEDLKESVLEMDEMESLRIEGELERQKASLRATRPNATTENRDSGVADMELLSATEKNGTLKADSTLKRSALSNSLLDIHEAVH